jgi:arabinose-5-phosphate isomerase
VSTPLEIARKVISDEAAALERMAAMFGERSDGSNGFDGILDSILNASQQLIVSGLGKSGNIAQKIAASLTSTGTPAVFMHPVEALHGDLGIVTERHGLLALSRSGNTEELLRFVAHFRRRGGAVISLTQNPESRLVELSHHAILLPDVPEAGPLNLAPTTSCVMMLAAGDALAMALLHKRGFQVDDFAQFHPEGALGRRLLLRAEDLMHSGESLPVVRADEPVENLIVEMTRGQIGLAVIVDAEGRLLGTFTDGDLRRIFERVANPRELDAREAYTRSRRTSDAPAVPVSTVSRSEPAVICLRFMESAQITSLVVVDEAGKPIGVLRLMDLVAAKL